MVRESNLQEATKIVALTDKYERISVGDVGRTTRDFVIFKHRIIAKDKVLRHPEDWQIKMNPSFVGTGTNVDDSDEKIPF